MAFVNDVTTTKLSGLNHIDALLSSGPGWNWLTPTRNTIYYTFSVASGNETGNTGISGGVSAFNATQQSACLSQFSYISNLTGITFSAALDAASADIHFADTNIITSSNTSGLCSWSNNYSYNGSNTITSYAANAYVYLDNVEWGSQNSSPTTGSQGYETLLHELGHALGLKHPFEGTTILASSEDNTANSIMSYTPSGGSHSTFSSYDVAALMWIYGGDGLGGSLGISTNGAYLVGNSNSNVINGGSGNDALEGLAGNDTLNGGAGSDTASFTGARANYTITAINTGGFTITSVAEGIDTLIDVEYAQFSDQMISLTAVDNTPPTVTTFSPADEAIAIAITSDIVVTFSEAIARGTGSIILKNTSGAIIATYDAATSSNLSIAGSTMTINPTADLAYSTGYTVEFALGSVKDIAGNSYAGTTSYNFTTQSNTITPIVSSKLDDFAILQQASPAIVGADEGNDTYLISGSMIAAGQSLTISDAKGSNSVQLATGLSIASSKVASNALQLTLTNGGVITINDANLFTYEAGGNSTAGINNADVSFASFALNTLGVNVPSNGIGSGGAVMMGQGAAAVVTQLVAGSSLPVTATSQADIFGFTPSAAKALSANTQIVLSQFDVAQDKLQFDLTTALGVTNLAALNGVDGISVSANAITNETFINFGLDANGDAVTLTLVGITSSGAVSVNM